MPRGDKSSYTGKQKRKAEHIEEGYEKRGVSHAEAERRAWGARGMLAELAVALRLPESTLARRLARLTRLEALPRLRDAHRRGEVSAWHLDVVLLFDALIVFTAGLFIIRSLEMYLRAKRVMAAAG